MKKEQNEFQKLISFIFDEISALGIVGLISIILGIIMFTGTFLQIFISALIGVKPIDDETGEYITMPWLVLLIIFGFGISLILLEKLYFYIKSKL